jgi:hypothetical protein
LRNLKKWRVLFTGNFKRQQTGSGRRTPLSVGPLLGKPREGLLFWRSGKILEGSGMKITHRGSTVGEFGRVLVYQVLEKALKMGTFLQTLLKL